MCPTQKKYSKYKLFCSPLILSGKRCADLISGRTSNPSCLGIYSSNIGIPLSVFKINTDTRRHRKLLNAPTLRGPNYEGMSVCELIKYKILKMIVLKKGAGKWYIKCQANSSAPEADSNVHLISHSVKPNSKNNAQYKIKCRKNV